MNNYNHRGGGNYGVVFCCPNLVAERLVYFDHNAQSGSWVIRDFIAGQRLDNHHSKLTVQQIQADGTHDEFPPWCAVEENPADWAAYLKLRTSASFRLGRAVTPTAPNPLSGTWESL